MEKNREKIRRAYAVHHDGARLFYTMSGQGEPALVLSSGIGCDQFIWKYLTPHFSDTQQIVQWNYRGHGRSSSPPAGGMIITMDEVISDLDTVLGEALTSRAILVGHSMGVQVCLEYHRQHPDQVMAMILICGSYGHPLDTLHNNDAAAGLLPLLRRLVKNAPNLSRTLWRRITPSQLSLRLASLGEINTSLAKEDDFMPYLEHLAEVDPELFLRMLAGLQSHSAEDHLPHVDVPVLVVAGERDRFTPCDLSRRMAESIPGAELLVVPEATHIAPLERPTLVNARIEKFIREKVQRG